MKKKMMAVAVAALGLCAQDSMADGKKVFICEAQCVAIDQAAKEVHQLGRFVQSGRNAMDAFGALQDECRIAARSHGSYAEAVLVKRLSYSESHTRSKDRQDTEWNEEVYEDETAGASSSESSRSWAGRPRRHRSESSFEASSVYSYDRRFAVRRAGSSKSEKFSGHDGLEMQIEYANRRDKDTCDREMVEEGWAPPINFTGPNGPWG